MRNYLENRWARGRDREIRAEPLSKTRQKHRSLFGKLTLSSNWIPAAPDTDHFFSAFSFALSFNEGVLATSKFGASSLACARFELCVRQMNI